MTTTVIDNAAIYTPLADGSVRWIPDGHIVIESGQVASLATGAWNSASNASDKVERIDARGRVALPGFVNSHTHTNLGLYPGLWDRGTRVPPYTSFMSAQDHRFANYLTMIAAVKSGTTTLCNCDRYMPALTVQTAEEIGIRTLSGAMAN